MAKMKSAELIAKAKDIAQNYKTAYIWGGLGRPITEANIQDAINQYSVNTKYAAGARRYIGQPKAFFFDCVGLIKTILWGWCGDSSQNRGGAKYGSNGLPDMNADTMISVCADVSTDFSNIVPGEALWMSGHIGIYIGDGLCAESTPAWRGGVQITAVANIGTKSGYNSRRWVKHGKLPYVDYSDQKVEKAEWEITIENAVKDGVVTSPDYWRNVLSGKTKASAANVKALMDKYHKVLSEQ